MSTPRAARVGRERVAGGSRRGSVAGAAPARRPPHSHPQLRLKPRQRHRIVVVIHVAPRSSSDLTARGPRASSIIIIITSLLGSLADTEPPSPLRQRRGEPPRPAWFLQVRRHWRMRCRLRCPSVPSSSGLMAPMALARSLWRRLIGTPETSSGLQIGTGSRRTHACWAQLRPTCVTGR